LSNLDFIFIGLYNIETERNIEETKMIYLHL